MKPRQLPTGKLYRFWQSVCNFVVDNEPLLWVVGYAVFWYVAVAR